MPPSPVALAELLASLFPSGADLRRFLKRLPDAGKWLGEIPEAGPAAHIVDSAVDRVLARGLAHAELRDLLMAEFPKRSGEITRLPWDPDDGRPGPGATSLAPAGPWPNASADLLGQLRSFYLGIFAEHDLAPPPFSTTKAAHLDGRFVVLDVNEVRGENRESDRRVGGDAPGQPLQGEVADGGARASEGLQGQPHQRYRGHPEGRRQRGTGGRDGGALRR